ncbi:MAG: RNA polymerase subunit sigma [Bradyrhizobiaceae bacterium]|nr:MAG: RNA polymerase subunit sigma [Bradyrhizobiaceae bacterium]
MSDRETELAALLRAANAGDAAAYARLLEAVVPLLRMAARRHLVRAGMDTSDAEDLVQETLLAIHLKRQTWDPARPVGPWLQAIVRHKFVDALRRRGRHVHVPVDDLVDSLPAEAAEEPVAHEVARHLGGLPRRQRDVVQAIAVDGASIRDAAARLAITEGAVRVALHRGLAALAAKLRH